MDIYGYSFKNGMVLRTDKVSVKAQRNKDNKINLEVSKRLINNIKSPSKYINIIYKIPFLRGIYNTIIINPNKTFNILFIIMILFDIYKYYTFKNNTHNSNQFEIISSLILISTLGFLFFYFKDIKSLMKYHGSEHKVINTYENQQEINFINVKNSSRICKLCGTMQLIFLILGYIISVFITRYNSLQILITFAISFEILEYSYKIPLVKNIYSLGLLLQKYFTTLEPDKEHIEVGIACINKLIEESNFKQ